MINILAITNRKLASIYFILGVLIVLLLVILFLYINHINKQKIKELKSLIINGITVDLEIKKLMTIVELIWRIEKKSTNEGVVIDRSIVRDFDRLKKELFELGFEYNDYENRKYIGINVDVLEAKTLTDIKEPIISKTVKPEILVNGNRVQKSLVVVSLPTKKGTFKIVFQPSDGIFIPEIIKQQGDRIEKLPIPKRENHIFLSWRSNKTQEEVVAPFNLQEDMELYPEWEEIVITAEIPVKNIDVTETNETFENYIKQVKNETEGEDKNE